MIHDYKFNLEGILYYYYIKFDRLAVLVNQTLASTGSDKLDIYIDLFDMLKPIYSRAIYADKQLLIVSHTINLAAHLRNYFWSRHKVMTRIFLVYGDGNTFNHTKFYENFGDSNIKQRMDYAKNNAFICSQLDLMKILVAYIEGVYFVKRCALFPMFVYNNINLNDDIPALVISKSKYAYQLPAMLKNTVLFRPYKNNNGDESYAITSENVNRLFFEPKSERSIEQLNNISSEFLSILVALNGFNEYNIKTVISINVAAKMLLEAIDQGKILNRYNNDVDYVYLMLQPGIDKYLDATSFKYRFNAMDLVFQHRIYNSSAEARDITWLIDLHDPETVRSLNNQYFQSNPLDLNNL